MAGHPKVPVVFFDSSSRIREKRQDRIFAGHVLALAPTRFEFHLDGQEGPAVLNGDAWPDLSGPWARYSVRDLIVGPGDVIWVGDNADKEAPSAFIHVTQSPITPSLDGSRLAGVWANGTIPVYVGPPRVVVEEADAKLYHFRLRPLLPDGHTTSGPLISLKRQQGGFVLPVERRTVGLYHLDVYGPLGSELRNAQFCQVSEGSTSDVPSRLLAPDEEVGCSVEIAGRLLKASAQTGQTNVQLPVLVEGLELTVEVSRLRWAVRRSRVSAPLETNVLTLTAQEIGGTDAVSILVSAQPGAMVTLTLLAGIVVLQSSTTTLRDGESTVSFPLGAFSDTISSSNEGRLRFFAAATSGETSVRALLANVLSHFEVSDLKVELLGDPTLSLVASWTETRTFTDRCLRLWPLTNPGAAPLVFRVPDNAHGHACWEVGTGSVVVGGFLAEMSVDDGWEVAVRPVMSPGSTYLEFGVTTEWLAPLGSAKEPEPEVEVARGLWVPGAGVPLSRAGADAAGAWLIALTAIKKEQSLDTRTVSGLRELLFEDPESATLSLLAAASRWQGDPSAVRHLEVVTLDDALTVPARALSEHDWDNLAEVLPVTWAAMDTDRAASRWRRITGWYVTDGCAPEAGLAVHYSFPNRTSEDLDASLARVRQNTAGTERDSAKLLSWGRHQIGVLGWLRAQNPLSNRDTRAWQQRWSYLNDANIRRHVKLAGPILFNLQHNQWQPTQQSRVTWFPADLLAAALHVIFATRELHPAHRALLAGSCIAPELAQRLVLVAIGLMRLEQAREGAL